MQAEDGIRDLVRSRGLGDVYKRQVRMLPDIAAEQRGAPFHQRRVLIRGALDEQRAVGLSLIHI